MATGPVDDEVDAFQRVQEYYQRRESKLKLKMVDIQRIPKQSRGRRKAVISLDHSTNLPAFKSIVSVEPEGLLGEYFALKVLTVIPRTEDVYLDELQGELRRASLPVTLAVYLNNQYIVGPKGLLVGTSPKCNVRLPLESGLKEQHFRVRAKVDKDLNEGETAGYFVESCVGEGDIAEVDDQHVPGFESYDPSNPVPSLNVPSIALSSSKVFISGQFVWQVVSLPMRTVASLQAFDAVRKENLSKLRSVLESRDNKLRGEGAPNDLESLIFDINGEEKVGEEYSNSEDNREERKSSSTRTNVLLHIAVQKENLEMVQLLLKKGADPNSFGGTHRRTALHYAAETDNVGILSTLLNHGGDVELKDINALPPVTLAKSHKVRKLLLNSVLLSSAALEGLYKEVECYLRQPNVTPNVLGLRHKSPLQLASIAGHHQVVGLLLGREANVDQCGGTHGRSALHYAAYHGHTETVRVLVDHRANMELKDIEGNTAMNLCTQADVLHLLSKETMPTLCDAVQSGDLEAAERLLLVNRGKEGYIEQRDSQMNTPLHIACRRGQLEMVRLLKKYGTNVNIAGGMERVTPICMAAKEGFAEVVEFLIGVGAEIEGENSSGETFSVREMVEDLIERCNRDLQQLRFTGRPPSHWDCNIYINRQTSLTCLETAGPIQMCQDTIDRLERVYELLFTGPERLMRAFETRDLHRFRELLKGDPPVSPNCILLPRENITALAYICEKNEYDYAKVLIEAGAELNIVGQTEQMPLLVVSDLGYLSLVELLVDRGINVNLQSRDTLSTALHECAREEIAVVRYLLKKGARKDLKNMYGETPFDLTVSQEGRRLLADGPQHVLIAASSGDISELKRLRDKEGYNPCALTFLNGWTALHEACKAGHVEVVKLLLGGDVAINAKGGTQLQTPLHLACLHGHKDVVALLLSQPDIRRSISSKDATGSVPYEVASTHQIHRLLVLHNPVQRILTMSERRSIDQNLCIICKDSAVEVVFIPCKHQICCYSCAERCHDEWRACPLCRGNIKNIEKC